MESQRTVNTCSSPTSVRSQFAVDRCSLTVISRLGCGTGKYLRLKSDLFTIGCDRSQPLCEITREKYSYLPIVIADNLHLPYRNDLFDAVLSIGVIHHLSSRERRVQAIQGKITNSRRWLNQTEKIVAECLRILKPDGGQLLIYTWAMEQKQRKVTNGHDADQRVASTHYV